MGLGTERRRAKALPHADSAALLTALGPLSEIVSALKPRARVTVLSISDKELQVMASMGNSPIPPGTNAASLSMSGLRCALRDAGHLEFRLGDEAVPAELHETLLQSAFEQAFLVPLNSYDSLTECVVVDEPGRRIALTARDQQLLTAAVAQMRVALDNVDLRARAAHRQRSMEAIAPRGDVFSSVLDLKKSADQVVEYASLLLDLPAFVLLSRLEGEPDFAVLAVDGVPLDTCGFRVTSMELEHFDMRQPAGLATIPLSGSPPHSIFGRFEELGMTSMVAAPLSVGEGRLHGILLGLDRRRLELSDDDREVLHLLAMQTTNALWNAERYEAERQARGQARRDLASTRVLEAVAEAATTSTSLQSVAQRVLDAIIGGIGLRIGAIYSYDQEDRLLTLLAVHGVEVARELIQSLPVAEDGPQLFVKAVLSQNVVTNWDTPSSETSERMLRTEGVVGAHQAIAIPLEYNGEIVGSSSFVFEREEPLSAEETELFTSIARIVGQAIANARLYESERERTRLARSIVQIHTSLASSLDLDEMLPRVLQFAASELGSSGAMVADRIEQGWRIREIVGAPATEVDRGAILSEEQLPRLKHMLATREPQCVADVADAVDVDEHTAGRMAARAFAAYPLIVRDSVIGVLTVHFDEPRELNAGEQDYLRRVAFAVSLSEETSRLYKVEHRIAETLQTALLALPERVPCIEFAHTYHSATEATRVGGDFYDVFELNHHHVGITIGDVAGKGLEAAVLTSVAKNTIRAHATERGKTPDQILSLANELVFRATAAETFVTVLFAILDCRDGRIVYSNAGHTTAAIVGRDGTPRLLPTTGPILGAFQEAEFRQSEANLNQDELLFLYTDGLTEARRERELYGEERLFRFLSETRDRSAADVVERTTAEVLSFTDDRLRDDLAILAVRRLAPGADVPVQQKFDV